MNPRRQGEKKPFRVVDGELPEDRLPPQNLEAEEGVLGAAILDNETIDDTAPILAGPEDFYRDSHQILWRTILKLRAEGIGVDTVTLADVLKPSGEYARIGGDETLSRILELPHAANAVFHAQIVAQKALARRVIDVANQILHEGYAQQITSEEMLRNAEQRIFAAGESSRTNRTASHVKTGSQEVLDEVAARAEGEGPGLSTGIRPLDHMLGGGFRPGEFIILAGRPSMGKTAFAMNLVENMSIFDARAILFISLEMGKGELSQRFLSSLSGVDGQLIRTGRSITPDTWNKLTAAHDRLAASPLWINDTSSVSIGTLASEARRQRRRNNIELLVIDYIQLMERGESGKRDNREQDVSDISRGLKNLARELKIPVVALCQLNRGVEHRESKRPRISDLRESGSLEQDADVILLMHRPEYYDPKNSIEGQAYCIVGKQRNGPIGDVALRFDKKTTKFTEWETPDAELNF